MRSATEAYLGTCRSRISLRRHARLVDYRVDEGENARVWAHVRANAEGVALPQGTLLLPRVAGVPQAIEPASAAATLLARRSVVFATLTAATLERLGERPTLLHLGRCGCCLAAGATAATLVGHLTALHVGNVLLFEEVLGPGPARRRTPTGARRWVVRLTRVHHTDRFGHALTDPGRSGEPDHRHRVGCRRMRCRSRSASRRSPTPRTAPDRSRNVSVAHGNMVPADHGPVDRGQALGTVPAPPWRRSAWLAACCVATAAPIVTAAAVFLPGAWSPRR